MKSTPLTQQTLFLTLGYPGSGKSYLARQLAESLGMVRISADRIRYELFEHPTYSRDEEAIVFRLVDYMLEEVLKTGASVIVDADFGLRKSRRLKYELARKHGIQSVLLWVQTDMDTAFNRASSRDGRKIDDRYMVDMSQENFNKLVDRLKKPEKEPTIVVSGKHVYKVQFTGIVRKLQQLGLLGQPTRRAVSPKLGENRKRVVQSRKSLRNTQQLSVNS